MKDGDGEEEKNGKKNIDVHCILNFRHKIEANVCV